MGVLELCGDGGVRRTENTSESSQLSSSSGCDRVLL